jgi:hypothetical protein
MRYLIESSKEKLPEKEKDYKAKCIEYNVGNSKK